MQYCQKNFMRIIGNDKKNNGKKFWEILERIIGKISSIIGAGLTVEHLLKDTPNKGHNRFNLPVKDILCGPYKTMVIQIYLLMRIMH